MAKRSAMNEDSSSSSDSDSGIYYSNKSCDI